MSRAKRAGRAVGAFVVGVARGAFEEASKPPPKPARRRPAAKPRPARPRALPKPRAEGRRDPIPRGAKQHLYGVQEHRCAGCGDLLRMRLLEVDHIVPVKAGGSSQVDNLQLLCAYCNRRKGTGTMDELRAKLNAEAAR